jgi:uncharacterized protein (TIGR03000 family)
MFVPVYVVQPAPEARTYESFYYNAELNTALMRVRLPENAELWISDSTTRQRGADRLFESPSLTPGREYVYHLKARWTENGKPVVRTHDVTIHAGDRVNVDLTQGK